MSFELSDITYFARLKIYTKFMKNTVTAVLLIAVVVLGYLLATNNDGQSATSLSVSSDTVQNVEVQSNNSGIKINLSIKNLSSLPKEILEESFWL